MKYAVVDGERREAQSGLSGECPGCGIVMIAKCGEYRVWHWAHQGIHTCDYLWEPETKWHRDWKNQFPEAWQEKLLRAEGGEKHIADVKTDRGVVLEFQHSFLHRDERESREMFHQIMVWVVDGLRRVRDRSRFFELLARAPIAKAKPLTFSLPLNKCALLRDWVDSRRPVFFDFGDNSEPGDSLSFPAPVLWRLEPRSPKGAAHLSPVLKTAFLNKYRKGLLLKGIDYSAQLRAVCAALLQRALQPPGRAGIEGYMEKGRRARARRRF
jgi:competence protein CoiA